MTVFITSLFLPYTIDFKATGPRKGRRKSSSPNHAANGAIVGRLADTHRQHRLRSGSLSLTPGATTEDEKIFKAYASHSADEIPTADDPKGPGPNEPRVIPWGHSRKFNQPRSEATTHPASSILSRPGTQESVRDSFFAGSSVPLDSKEQGSPRALLSDVDWAVKAAEQGNGGLQNAIHAAEQAGLLKDKMWVGTLGMPTDSLTDLSRSWISDTLREQYQSLTVFVADSEFEGHYAHFCRAVLWPALHYQMQESPRHNGYDDYSWKQYLKVNEAFADVIAANWQSGDRIWVNDYHLLALPSLLRKRLPRASIGFFMHSAFPSSEVFRCLNQRDALLDGLLGADLIGFQTEEYCHHFLHTCSRLRRLEVSVDGVQVHDRFVHVKTFPLGIDYKSLNALRQSVEVKGWISNIGDRYRGKHLIVARDRLDTSGGIKQKLLAYELFLKSYPKWRENVVLIQVASSASELPELQAQVSKIAMRINSIYSTLTHQPLVLLQQDISYSQFLALLSVAEIYMVTNLREGMNLTSHDFIHCQDGALTSQRHGSLILSEFVGSASIFHDHELLVNPWDYQQCADAINTALEMSPEHKQRNWEFLLTLKSPHTALAWYTSLQAALSEVHSLQVSRETTHVSPLSLPDLQESYRATSNRVFFLEDEALFGADESQSLPTNKVSHLLETLLQDPKNTIFLTSNRSPDQLDQTITSMNTTAIGLIAENGSFTKGPGTTHWEAQVNETQLRDWTTGITKMMSYFRDRTEGSILETRRCTLSFRYDHALDMEVAARQASELADQINGIRGGEETIRVVRDVYAISVEPLHASKAVAATALLRVLPVAMNLDFVFVVGSKRADESLFRWANRLALLTHRQELGSCLIGEKIIRVTTVTVGTHVTEAKAVLPVGLDLIDVLGKMVERT